MIGPKILFRGSVLVSIENFGCDENLAFRVVIRNLRHLLMKCWEVYKRRSYDMTSQQILRSNNDSNAFFE